MTGFLNCWVTRLGRALEKFWWQTVVSVLKDGWSELHLDAIDSVLWPKCCARFCQVSPGCTIKATLTGIWSLKTFVLEHAKMGAWNSLWLTLECAKRSTAWGAPKTFPLEFSEEIWCSQATVRFKFTNPIEYATSFLWCMLSTFLSRTVYLGLTT